MINLKSFEIFNVNSLIIIIIYKETSYNNIHKIHLIYIMY